MVFLPLLTFSGVCLGLAASLYNHRRVQNLLNQPLVIAPFQVVGKDDSEGKLGTTLAYLLSSQLVETRRQMNSTIELGRDNPRNSSWWPRYWDLSPNQVNEPLESDLMVGGVAVNAIISLLHRLDTKNRLKIFVQYLDDKAILVGKVSGLRNYTLYLPDLDLESDKIAEKVAYRITQLELSKYYLTRGTLDDFLASLALDDFQTLLSTSHRATELKQSVTLGLAHEETCQELLGKMKILMDKMPKSDQLSSLVKSLANKMKKNTGDDDDIASRFSQQLLEMIPSDEDPKS